MTAKLADGFRALTAAGAGIALYFLGDAEGWGWIGAIILLTLMAWWGCLAGGRRVLSDHPVAGVWLMTGWTISLIAIGAAITTLLTLAAVTAAHELAGLGETKAEVVGGAIVGALTTLAGGLFTKDLEEGTGDFSVAAKTEAAFGETFANRFEPTTRQYAAVYEGRVGSTPTIKGWGLRARLRRAKAIS